MHDISSRILVTSSPSNGDLLAKDVAGTSSSPSPADSSASNSSTSQQQQQQQESELLFPTLSCGICLCQLDSQEFSKIKLFCDNEEHLFCNVCLQTYFEIKIREGSVKFCPCPSPKCTGKSSQLKESEKLTFMKGLVNDHSYAKYDQFLYEKCLLRMRDMTWCINKACSAPIIVTMSRKEVCCPKCSTTFCWKCDRNPHYGACLKREEMKDPDPIDMMSVDWIRRTTRPCPRCNIQIEKNGGCDHMYCARCSTPFNWSSTHNGQLLVPFKVEKSSGQIRVTSEKVVDEPFLRKYYIRFKQPKFNQSTQACPECQTKFIKPSNLNGQNNHVSCQNCRTKFCFLCGEKAVTTHHFTISTCQQHTTREKDELLFKKSKNKKNKEKKEKEKEKVSPFAEDLDEDKDFVFYHVF